MRLAFVVIAIGFGTHAMARGEASRTSTPIVTEASAEIP
jgi:hypothetical protein